METAEANACAAQVRHDAIPADFDPIAYINEPRWQASRYGLERITALLEALGRPQDSLRFVHVAGTNGKGSTCAFIASALQHAGLKTGLFTSPYLIRFEERIQVDGEMIAPDDLRSVTWDVRAAAEDLAAATGDHPTEFELMCAVALLYFARQKCDICVLEVGMGGRFDATNAIDAPEVCVITRLGLDHTAFLGDTLGEIAAEKAAIIKRGAAVVAYPPEDAAAARAITAAADAAGCAVAYADFSALELGAVEAGVRAFSYKDVPFTTRLLGSYQPENAAVAIEVLRALAQRGWAITESDISAGIAETCWPGRFEVVQSGAGAPAIIVDGGHNPQGAQALRASLDDVFPGVPITFVMSVLADKDYEPMVAAIIDRAQAVFCVTPPNPRALAAADLAQVVREQAQAAGVDVAQVEPCDTFEAALSRAVEAAGASGVVCAFGSLYSIASIKAALA